MSIINYKLNDCLLENHPFPHIMKDNFLKSEIALKLQNEILNIQQSEWDRYNNPFEQKYTLRDKYNFPPELTKLFDKLTSDEFVTELSNLVGYKLKLDTTRNFWGVHTYGPGDKLDIHVDAGLHPSLGLKKQIIYQHFKRIPFFLASFSDPITRRNRISLDSFALLV